MLLHISTLAVSRESARRDLHIDTPFQCRVRVARGKSFVLACFFGYYIFASKVTEIGRLSVVMYVSDKFVYGKLQLTENGVSIVWG